MRTVKHRADTVKDNPHPRSGAFIDLSAAGRQEGFDIGPCDCRSHGIREYGLQGPTMVIV
jgi:hypothetical protein